MFHWLTWKSYSAIGIGTALVFFFLGKVAGTQLFSIVHGFELSAMRGGMSQGLTSLITEPIRIALEGNVIVCAIIGVVWPIVILWVLLLFLLMIFAVIGPGLGRAGTTIDGK